LTSRLRLTVNTIRWHPCGNSTTVYRTTGFTESVTMPHLFDELQLRDVVLRNRISVSPMCEYSCTEGMAAAPCFAIRRPAVAVFTLGDYADAGIMSGAQAELLCAAVRERKNILVAGGTSTGKTTLVNALLAEVAKTGDRVVLIEDTRELQCAAPNLVALRTKDGAASLSDLVRSALRLRPDRM